MDNITNKAMLISLRISQWTARKFDKVATEKVQTEFNSDKSMGRYNKSLVAVEAIKGIKQASGRARTFFYENTLPWGKDGSRILPADNFQEFSSEMRVLRAKFEQEVDNFVNNYQAYIDAAKVKLNGLFNPDEYPDVSEIENKYKFEVTIDPLPAAEDFRINLSREEVEKIKRGIEERTQHAQLVAHKELWNRLYSTVKHMADRLSDDKAVFRDTLIGNIGDLCQLLPRLNITGDQDLEAMRRDVEEKLTKFDPQTLRTDTRKRAEASTEAKKILKNMGSFCWGDVAKIKGGSDE